MREGRVAAAGGLKRAGFFVATGAGLVRSAGGNGSASGRAGSDAAAGEGARFAFEAMGMSGEGTVLFAAAGCSFFRMAAAGADSRLGGALAVFFAETLVGAGRGEAVVFDWAGLRMGAEGMDSDLADFDPRFGSFFFPGFIRTRRVGLTVRQSKLGCKLELSLALDRGWAFDGSLFLNEFD